MNSLGLEVFELPAFKLHEATSVEIVKVVLVCVIVKVVGAAKVKKHLASFDASLEVEELHFVISGEQNKLATVSCPLSGPQPCY